MSDPETGSNDVKGRMLPGIAAICLYLIVMTTANVYAGLTGVFGSGPAKYGSLALCSLLAAGIYGLLRLQKWGWALVTAGCLLFATGYVFYFSKSHAGFFLIQGLFGLIFFLYLIRQETRERLH
ncbi:MAG: hypothetical protein ABSG84_09175 [Acidobacteriaceae bacterium]|jgi:hypothetical protein